MDTTVDIQAIEHLDFAYVPPCDWKPRDLIDPGPCPRTAVWAVMLTPRRCGCPSPSIILLSQECLDYVLSSDTEMYTCRTCNATISAQQERDRIISMERI